MEHAFLDEYSNSESVINRIEPRVKILAFLFFILVIAFIPLETIEHPGRSVWEMPILTAFIYGFRYLVEPAGIGAIF